jgi:putative transposase
MRKPYDSDLSHKEWTIVEPLLPESRTKPNQHSKREMLNAIFYLQKTGCPWRMLPHDFPPYPTVAYPYYRWKKMGVFERINLEPNKLYCAEVGKEPTPSAWMVDSQTVATSSVGGPAAYDGNQKKKGQKRNVWVDTPGLPGFLHINTAHIHDTKGAQAMFLEAKDNENLKNVKTIFADAGYKGEVVETASAQNGWKIVVVTAEKGK